MIFINICKMLIIYICQIITGFHIKCVSTQSR